MRIVFLCSENLRHKLFSDDDLTAIGTLGEVVFSADLYETKNYASLIRDVDVIITSWGSPVLEPNLLDLAPSLGLVAHAGGTIKPLLDEEKTVFKRGIRVFNSAVCLSEGVSETALGFTLTGIKDVYARNAAISEGGWRENMGDVQDPYKLTIGVVGCGYAGSHYIELLRPFSLEVLVYDPYVSDTRLAELGATRVSFEELLRRSDVVSLHVAATPETEYMINRKTLKLMKDRAILINTSRGIIINEDDLADHLLAGKLKYAMLDATWPEPPDVNHRLRKIPNCIMTPHIAGLATNGLHKVGRHVYEEIERYRDGRELIAEVTAEMVAKMA